MNIKLSQDQLNQIHIAALALEIDSEYAVQAVLDEALRSYAEQAVATHEMKKPSEAFRALPPKPYSKPMATRKTFQIHHRRGR